MASGSDGSRAWNSYYGHYVDRRSENARKRETDAAQNRDDRSARLVKQLKEKTAEVKEAEAQDTEGQVTPWGDGKLDDKGRRRERITRQEALAAARQAE
ncbi:unnamed protein product, partial [Symbiodinium sp. CCMP2592]